MNEDFGSAAARHWDDAVVLFHANRFDNAAYLTGYVVECCLKALIQAAGMAPKPFSHDVATLAGDVLLLACTMAPSVRRYGVPSSPELGRLLNEWTPGMRYWPTGHVVRTAAGDWIRAAETVYRAILIERILDGCTEVL
jgi:HEPN domain-containing protein